MVQHIVMWNLRDDVNKDEAAAQMKQKLEALVGQVPGLVDACVVRSFGGYDVALVSHHDSKEALAVYQDHPAHVLVKSYVHSVAAERVFCDAEM